MFDNLLYQKNIRTDLIQSLKNGSLPNGLLFYGPPLSGKLTAALELARVLSCINPQEKGTWNCDCRACRDSRLLESPDTILAGPGFHLEEVKAAADLVQQNDNLAVKYLFYRSIQKLLRRFDPFLWQGEENRQKKWLSTLAKVRESLDELEPVGVWPEPKKLAAVLEGLLKDCGKLASFLPGQGLPINVIRNISHWAHTTSRYHKVVILTKADTLGEASRNALLKVLEEPPVGVTFVLLTNQKGAIMPTIISRVRAFRFWPRTIEQEQDLVGKIYRTQGEDYQGLKDFFLKIRSAIGGNTPKIALEFWDALSHRDAPFPSMDLDLKNPIIFRSLLEELFEALRNDFRQKNSSGWNLEFIELAKEKIHETLSKKEKLNIGPQLLLETLFFRLRKAL
jgi:DNA polymerase III delta prime subunit